MRMKGRHLRKRRHLSTGDLIEFQWLSKVPREDPSLAFASAQLNALNPKLKVIQF